MKKYVKKYKYIFASILILAVGLICASILNVDAKAMQTGNVALSNKSIGWGVKRADNHEQPDLVKRMIDEGHIVGNHSSYALIDMLKRE